MAAMAVVTPPAGFSSVRQVLGMPVNSVVSVIALATNVLSPKATNGTGRS